MRRDLVAAAAGAILSAMAVHAQTYDPLQVWNQNHWGIESTATVKDCLACHEGTTIHANASHPVDVDYAAALSRPRSSLRPLEQVVRRGVLLADGKVHCFTCHDPRSSWKFHVAIPPGAGTRSAVMPGVPFTYDRDPAPPAPGSEVSPTPLCLCCHAYD